MNSSMPRSDLSEYVAVVWEGRNVILLATAGCVMVMAALTWAMPRIYIVRSEIDAGVLAVAQPVETNLLMEAVDRSQFTVEGGRFPEIRPKGLTVTWRPPSTMRLEARSTDPAGAVRRLQVLTAAVKAKLETRLQAYAVQRASMQKRVVTASDDAKAGLLNLEQLMNERSTVAMTSVAQAYAAAAQAASERASFQRTAGARYRQLLRQRRDVLLMQSDVNQGSIASVRVLLGALRPDDDYAEPENIVVASTMEGLRQQALEWLVTAYGQDPVLAKLSDVVQLINAYDIRVARSRPTEHQRAVQLRLSEERLTIASGLALLGSTPAVVTPAVASFAKRLGELAETYTNDPPMASAIRQTTAIFGNDLANAYRDWQPEGELPSLTGTPKVLVAPEMPLSPALPRPAVNLAVAFLFGLVGSTTVVVFASRLRAADVS